MKVLFVVTLYQEFLTDAYAAEPALAALPYEVQRDRLLGDSAAVVEAYELALRPLGCETAVAIVNADPLQARWANDHGLTPEGNVHDRRRAILARQVAAWQPDVVHVFEWSPLGDAFLGELRPRVPLLSGQIASPLRPERTYAAYDLMISSWPPIVDRFRRDGIGSEYIRHAFDARVLAGLTSGAPEYGVTFVGGFAPSHPNRAPWLERILRDVPVDIFGYGLERVPAESPIHRHHRGAAWGHRMYEVLHRSRMTLNLHAIIDVRGEVDTNVAANMRLFEATGVGTCLVTEWKPNLHEHFDPDREVISFRSDEECVEKLRYYLANDAERRAIAEAGHRRTMRDHVYEVRMGELKAAWEKHLRRTGRSRS
jgi:hypothetical protein